MNGPDTINDIPTMNKRSLVPQLYAVRSTPICSHLGWTAEHDDRARCRTADGLDAPHNGADAGMPAVPSVIQDECQVPSETYTWLPLRALGFSRRGAS